MNEEVDSDTLTVSLPKRVLKCVDICDRCREMNLIRRRPDKLSGTVDDRLKPFDDTGFIALELGLFPPVFDLLGSSLKLIGTRSKVFQYVCWIVCACL
jgi:hypothetical protein